MHKEMLRDCVLEMIRTAKKWERKMGNEENFYKRKELSVR